MYMMYVYVYIHTYIHMYIFRDKGTIRSKITLFGAIDEDEGHKSEQMSTYLRMYVQYLRTYSQTSLRRTLGDPQY